MRWSRPPRYFGVAALALVVVLGVAVATRGGDHTSVPPSRAPDRDVTVSSVTAAHPGRATASGVRLPSVAIAQATASAAAPVSVSPDPAFPTELPDSPSLERMLSRDGTSVDWREGYTYQLGLMASYETCMGGRIARGIVYYYVTWQVDADHLASSPTFEFADMPAEGNVSSEDKLAFAACVKTYLAEHDVLYLPHAEPPRLQWGMGAIFPLSDSPLLQAIAKVGAERR